MPAPPPPAPAPATADTASDTGGAKSVRAAQSAPLQGAPGITATGGGTLVNVHASSQAGGLPPASGTVLGVTGDVRYRRFELGVRYMEGSLQSRDLVEGAVALRFATTPWLTLQTGP